MPKRILEMTALEVSRLRVEGSHAVGGVSGLYLRIEGGSRTWVLRYVHMRQRRRMGLGSYPGVTLAAAREAAQTQAQAQAQYSKRIILSRMGTVQQGELVSGSCNAS